MVIRDKTSKLDFLKKNSNAESINKQPPKLTKKREEKANKL